MLLGKNLDKENNSSQVNEGGSPPISARLQELSNNLKSLYFSTPSYKEMAAKNDNFHSQTSTNFVEPKTPDQSINLNDREVASFYSPWETFSTRSAGMKVESYNLISIYLVKYLLHCLQFPKIKFYFVVVEIDCSRTS